MQNEVTFVNLTVRENVVPYPLAIPLNLRRFVSSDMLFNGANIKLKSGEKIRVRKELADYLKKVVGSWFI